jgi:PAS domain S-box-containing protein
MNQLKLVIKGGEALTFENMIPWRGESFWFFNQMYPIRDEKGRMIAVGLIARNITERRQAEEALRESEENFKALAENANDGIVIGTGEEGYHVYANRRAVEITGYPIEELLKTRLKDLAYPDELPKLTERYKKRLAGLEVPKPYETALLNKDGIKVPVEISLSKTTWQNQPADMVILHDVTERKRAEEALRENEAYFSTIFHGRGHRSHSDCIEHLGQSRRTRSAHQQTARTGHVARYRISNAA